MPYPVGISSPKLETNKKGYVMSQNKVITLKKPGENSEDLLTELLRTGAQRLIADAGKHRQRKYQGSPQSLVEE